MRRGPLSFWALSKESLRFWKAIAGEAGIFLPQRVLNALILDTQLLGGMDKDRLSEIVGASALSLFDTLGPIYGKVAQTALTRLPHDTHDWMERLQITRLYSDWPAIPFLEVQMILDKEIPFWRKIICSIEPQPLGVASMAQVHAAKAYDGQEWVIKIIKPHARLKMIETVTAIEELADKLALVAITKNMRRFVAELRVLTASLLQELNLEFERSNLLKAAAKLGAQDGVLRIPKVLDALSTKNVIVMQRFFGVRLSDVVSGKVELTSSQRTRLARGVLKELLVQVFELGLFHADPHAGNLILLDDDAVGLFDWGLAGELKESDRVHIAAMLRAIMLSDFERLAEALRVMAAEAGVSPDVKKLKRDLEKLALKMQKNAADKIRSPASPVPIQSLVEDALKVASKHSIPIPPGLLLMVKALITIEGLARGIDPSVSLKKIAAPVLLRAARPTIRDFLVMAKRFPKVLKKISP